MTHSLETLSRNAHRVERRLTHERLRGATRDVDDCFDTETAAMRHRAASTALSPARPPFVLLAKDDTSMRELLASALRKGGCVVRELSSRAELLIEIETLVMDVPSLIPVDLIVSDVCMPGLSGLELLHDVRGAQLETPFILVTAFGSDEVRQAAVGMGASYLEKPFRMKDFQRAVGARLRQQQQGAS